MSQIEETRREMYRLLAHLKSNPTGVVLMAEFESAMEAHLEVLHKVKADLIVLASDYQQGAKVEADAADEARSEVRILKKKLDKRTGRISQLKAWMRAAVRDNQRLRKDRKAFLETQDEHLSEIQRLRMVLDTQSGLCGCDSCSTKTYKQATVGIHACASPASLQEARPMNPHWKDAPEWAKWLAQDKDGQWYWFEDKPEAMGCREWLTLTGGCFEWARTTLCHRHWFKTLESRP